MQQATHAIEKLTQQPRLHPAVALPLFPLLTADPEEFSSILQSNIQKSLPQAPMYVMDQALYLQQVADSLDHLAKTDRGALLQLDIKVKRLAVKAALDLLKADSKYAAVVNRSKELLEKLFRESSFAEEVIDGKVDNEPLWNGKPSLDAYDWFLLITGVCLLFFYAITRTRWFGQFHVQ